MYVYLCHFNKDISIPKFYIVWLFNPCFQFPHIKSDLFTVLRCWDFPWNMTEKCSILTFQFLSNYGLNKHVLKLYFHKICRKCVKEVSWNSQNNITPLGPSYVRTLCSGIYRKRIADYIYVPYMRHYTAFYFLLLSTCPTYG